MSLTTKAMILLAILGFSFIIGLILLVISPIIAFEVIIDKASHFLGSYFGSLRGENAPPDKFYNAAKTAEQKTGVPWYILCALAKNECSFNVIEMPWGVQDFASVRGNYTVYLASKVSTNKFIKKQYSAFVEIAKEIGIPENQWTSVKSSSCAAIGPMQFLPTTFNAYKKYTYTKNPFNLIDAMIAAGEYLKANGKQGTTKDPQSWSKAIFAYNQDSNYVKSVINDAYKFMQMEEASSGNVVSTSLGNMVYPANGAITSPFGYRIHPIYKTRKFHSGIDIAAKSNSPVYAAMGGTVTTASIGYNGGYGNTIRIESGSATYGYMHLNDILVNRGSTVQTGQMIGRVGSTGRSTGPHLHFEITINGSKVNPLNYLNRSGFN